jgi:ABC-type sugar transport system substrate-binding protein
MRVEGQAQGVCAFHHFLLNSKGTKNMVEQAVKANLPVWTWEMGIPKLLPFIMAMKRLTFK